MARSKALASSTIIRGTFGPDPTIRACMWFFCVGVLAFEVLAMASFLTSYKFHEWDKE